MSTPCEFLRIASTLLAAAMVASRLVPAGIVCVTLIVFCPELSKRLVLRSGASDIVPRKMATAATMVTILWSRVHLRAGSCLLYTSDAADEEDSVDLGG